MTESKTNVMKVTTTQIQLDDQDLRKMLRKHLPDLYVGLDARKDRITFQIEVPTGGDYSGQRLAVDRQLPLVVVITRTEVYEEDQTDGKV